MATTQTTTKASTRKATSIGSHVAQDAAEKVAKAKEQAVKLTVQDKDLKVTELPKDAVKKAAAIVHGFRKANTELVTIKEQLEQARGGLSSIVWQVCKVAAEVADAPSHRLAYAKALLASAELAEREAYRVAHKMPTGELPSVKEAIGSSWQTYKSQMLRCMERGVNPADFANATAFIEAANKSGNQTRGTRRRNDVVGTEATATDSLETSLVSKGMHAALAAALKQLIEVCTSGLQGDQTDYAARINRVATAIAKEEAKHAKGATPQADEARTGTMQ